MSLLTWPRLFLISLTCLSQAALAAPSTTITGSLTNAAGDPVERVTITLKNKFLEKTITVDGVYTLERVPPGSYDLTVQAPGYATETRKINPLDGQTLTVDISFKPQTLSLSQVVLAPSTFSLLSKPVASSQHLDRETIRNTPHFGDDVYRALTRLPGATGSDISAGFNIRGGEYREVLVNYDGMDLFQPFHLKDFTGVFSIIDPEMIGGLTLTSGGYAAKYGNAQSGVLEMKPVLPTENKMEATLSFGNIGFRSEGSFADGLGTWLFSGRRGYLDILLSIAGDEEEEGEQEESDIKYFDTLGRITYALGERHNWSLNYLYAVDTFMNNEIEEGEVESADSDYDDLYLWTKVSSVWTDKLSSDSMLFYGSNNQDRAASGAEVGEEFNLRDNRGMDWFGVKQDWNWEINDNNLLNLGWEYRDVSAEYDYLGFNQNDTPVGDAMASSFVETQLSPTGEEWSAWLSHRFRLNPKLYGELGLRYDRQTLAEDRQVSPRLNLYYQFNDQTSARFAYGTYYQPERAHELQIAYGENTFQTPEKSVHWMLGMDHRFGNGLNLRLEAYLKDRSNLRTRYENLTRVTIQYAGFGPDVVALPVTEGYARGVEFTMQQNLGGKFSWNLNYAWSQAEDELNGRDIARQWDQEHAVNMGFDWRPGPKWNFNLAWLYHTGWRTTPISAARDENGSPILVAGDVFSDTFPAYHRMDLRINRRVVTRNKRSFELFLDVSNLYNRKNVRGYEDWSIAEDASGNLTTVSARENWLPILPTFGMTWKF